MELTNKEAYLLFRILNKITDNLEKDKSGLYGTTENLFFTLNEEDKKLLQKLEVRVYGQTIR
jgi:hypothetical protein